MSGIVQVKAVVAATAACSHEAAKASPETVATVGHVLLHEVEAGGNECHANQQVECRAQERHLDTRIDIRCGFRSEISEADSGEGREAEVDGMKEGPLVGVGEGRGSSADVADHKHEAEGDGHGACVALHELLAHAAAVAAALAAPLSLQNKHRPEN